MGTLSSSNKSSYTNKCKLNSYTNTSHYVMVHCKTTPYVTYYTFYINKSDLDYTKLLEKVKKNLNRIVIITFHMESFLSKKKIMTDIAIYSDLYTGKISQIVKLETNTHENSNYSDYCEFIFVKQKKDHIFVIKRKYYNELDTIKYDNEYTIKYKSMTDNIYVITDVAKA